MVAVISYNLQAAGLEQETQFSKDKSPWALTPTWYWNDVLFLQHLLPPRKMSRNWSSEMNVLNSSLFSTGSFSMKSVHLLILESLCHNLIFWNIGVLKSNFNEQINYSLLWFKSFTATAPTDAELSTKMFFLKIIPSILVFPAPVFYLFVY